MHSWTLDLSVQSPCVDSVESRCTDSVVNDRGGFWPRGACPIPYLAVRGLSFSLGDPLSNPLRGADRDRTDDLRLAKPALSQLSYSPRRGRPAPTSSVGQGRLELPTLRLSGVRSNHLSYWPSKSRGGGDGAPPTHLASADLNCRPYARQALRSDHLSYWPGTWLRSEPGPRSSPRPIAL